MSDEPMFTAPTDVAPSAVELSERRNAQAHKAAMAAKAPTLVVRDRPATREPKTRKGPLVVAAPKRNVLDDLYAQLERDGKVKVGQYRIALGLYQRATRAELGAKTAKVEGVDEWVVSLTGEKRVAAVQDAKKTAGKPAPVPPKQEKRAPGSYDALWAALVRDGTVDVLNEEKAVSALYKRAKVAGLKCRSEKTGPAVWRVELVAEVGPGKLVPLGPKFSTPKAAPKAKRTSVAPKSPTAPLPDAEAKGWRDLASAPMVVSVNPTPSMVLVRDGSRIEVYVPSRIQIVGGSVTVEPVGGGR